jgi:hypothetical protein
MPTVLFFFFPTFLYHMDARYAVLGVAIGAGNGMSFVAAAAVLWQSIRQDQVASQHVCK